MARLARAEVFDPSEVALLHICARVVRRCYLLGVDPVTGKTICEMDKVEIYPGSHYVTDKDQLKSSIRSIQDELLQGIFQRKFLSNHFLLRIDDRATLFLPNAVVEES